MADRFDGVLYGVSEDLREVLFNVSTAIKKSAEEIRLRADMPLSLTVMGQTVFVKKSGQTCRFPQEGMVYVTKNDVKESFRLLSNNSVFSREEELKNGYLRLQNGSRAGVFGTLTPKGIMDDIKSINIRIAREIRGVATKLASSFRGEGWLIAGPPASGKTTLLRDFIRQISSGNIGRLYRVSVIDSRGEIGGFGGSSLGYGTDIVNCEDKARGMEIALRTMFPEVIAFDEIGTVAEFNRVKECFNAGVSVITTAHIGELSELLKRDVTRELLLSGAIKRVAVLPKRIGGEILIKTHGEIINDDS